MDDMDEPVTWRHLCYLVYALAAFAVATWAAAAWWYGNWPFGAGQ